MGIFSIVIPRKIFNTDATGSLCWGVTADSMTVMICSRVTVGERRLTGSGSRGVRRAGNWMGLDGNRRSGFLFMQTLNSGHLQPILELLALKEVPKLFKLCGKPRSAT